MSHEKKPPAALPAFLQRVEKFFTEDLWAEPAEVLHWNRRAWRGVLRFGAHVFTGMQRHRLPMRAAWLAYVSLLALVPLLAVGLSVSKSLLQDRAEEYLPRVLGTMVSWLAPQLQNVPSETKEAAQAEVVARIQEFLGNINASTLGVSGVVMLGIVAISLLTAAEAGFNDIWDITRGRSWLHKVVYYWAIITLGPLLVFSVMALTATAQFELLRGKLFASPILQTVVPTLTPFVVLWLLLGALYYTLPNTKVRWRPALFGGVVAGTLWQLNNLCAWMYMSKVLSYSKIYGTLGIIPIFLIGLYFSWFIVLLGAEVARAAQQVREKPIFGTKI